MRSLVDEEVGGVVSVDRLPGFIVCFRWVLSHDNREEARLINTGETVETERHNRNNCFENSSEAEIAVSLGHNKVVPVS